jgi:hypothetical protein
MLISCVRLGLYICVLYCSSLDAEIYEDTYEKLQKQVRDEEAHQARAAAHRAALAAGAAKVAPSAGADARARAAARLQRKRDARAAGLPEPDSDSDSDDDAEEITVGRGAASSAASAAAASSSAASASPSAAAAAGGADGVSWLYRWSAAASDSELQGPFPSSKMAGWKAAGLIGPQVIVQRVLPGADAATQAKQPWIPLAQIDFNQPHVTLPAQAPSNAASAQQQVAAPAKKKFKF